MEKKTIKLLAANRSEIAVRIFRSATELGCAPLRFMPMKTIRRSPVVGG